MSDSLRVPEGFWVCTLSAERRDELLGYSPTYTENSDDEANKTLKCLQRLDPANAPYFRLRLDSLQQAPFRLLLRTVEGQDETQQPRIESFVALSYCWHNADWEVAERLKNAFDSDKSSGSYCPTSQRMFEALCDQLLENEGLWIDQLCIDQTNAVEQRAAISSSHRIYENARLVVVALEDVQLDDADLDFASEQQVRFTTWNAKHPAATFQDTFNHEAGFVRDQAMPLLEKLCKARWFSRAWCFYELCLAQNVAFLVTGSPNVYAFSSYFLSNILFLAVTRSYVSTASSAGTPHSVIEDVFDRLHWVESYRDQAANSGDLFYSLLKLGARYNSDILSNALYLAGIGLTYVGEVRDKETLYLLYNMALLAAGISSPYFLIGEPIWIPSARRHSWLRYPTSRISVPDVLIPNEHQMRDLSWHEISLNGFVLMTKPNLRPSAASTQQADEIWYAISKSDNVGRPTWFAASLQSLSPAKFKQCLASALDGGTKWMKRFVDQYTSTIPDVAHLFADPTNVLSPELLSTISQYEAVLDEDRQATMGFISMILQSQTLLEFEYWSVTLGSQQAGGIMHALGPGSSNEEDILIVPEMFSGNEFAFNERLWVLAPAKDENGSAWRIVEKRQLYGAPVLKEVAGVLVLERGLRIIGGSK